MWYNLWEEDEKTEGNPFESFLKALILPPLFCACTYYSLYYTVMITWWVVSWPFTLFFD